MKTLLAFFLLTGLAIGQTITNGAPSLPAPTNDPSVGTQLNHTATINTNGNAILASTSDTTGPVFIVTSHAGLSGNPGFATSGIAQCLMDNNESGTAMPYVVNSIITAGDCHAQSAVSSGVYVIGFLYDSATSTGIKSNVIVAPFIYGGSGGGGGGSVGPGTVATIAEFGPSTTTVQNSPITDRGTAGTAIAIPSTGSFNANLGSGNAQLLIGQASTAQDAYIGGTPYTSAGSAGNSSCSFIGGSASALTECGGYGSAIDSQLFLHGYNSIGNGTQEWELGDTSGFSISGVASGSVSQAEGVNIAVPTGAQVNFYQNGALFAGFNNIGVNFSFCTSGQYVKGDGTGCGTPVAASVTSVFGQTGAITALTVPTGDSLSATGSGSINATQLVSGTWLAPPSSIGSGTAVPGTSVFTNLTVTGTCTGCSTSAVTSFNTRTGAVVPASGDYSVSQITGAAPLASPTFTGTVAGITPTMIGLGNVTNNAQAFASIHPNTPPAAGYIPIGNSGGTAYAPVGITGDSSVTSAGVWTNAKINGIGVSGTPSVGYVPTATSSTAATWQALPSPLVSSVFGRTGAVVSATSDYAFSQISGVLALGQIPAGGSSSTYLRGDGTWNTPTGAGNVSNVGTPTNLQIAQWTGATTIQGLGTTGTGSVVLAASPTLTGSVTFSGLATGCATFTTGVISSTGTACGSGGGMVFPAGSGIPVVSGGSSWGTTLAQSGTGSVAMTGSPTFTGTVSGITATMVGLGNVTNDAQTKAAVVPNTAPSAAQILVGNAGGTAYAPVAVTGGLSITSAGVATVTALNSGVVPTAAQVLGSNGSNQLVAATLQGNGAKVQLSSGTATSGHCVQFDASGNDVDSGLPCGGAGYPAAGIANSTGSAWTTPYSTTGAGSVIALATSPSFVTPTLGAATATSINGTVIPASPLVTSAASLTQYAPMVGGGSQGSATISATGTSGQALLSGGASANPAYGALNLAGGSSIVTGILPIGNLSATVVNASSPGVGIAHFAGSTQTVTSSAVNLAGADVTGQLPIGSVGSSGLSGASPVTISAAGAIGCATCVVTGVTTLSSLTTAAGGAFGTAAFTSTPTASSITTLIQGLTGCNTAGYVYTPQASDCVVQSGGSGMIWPAGGAGIPNYAGSSAWGTSYTTTGSGAVLALATSPTLVTPILGTPTSVTLTNATGYLLSALAAPTGNLSLNTSTYTNTFTAGDFGASPVTGIWNFTDNATSSTDISPDVNISVPAGSYHQALGVSVDGFNQFSVCNIGGSSHLGTVMFGGNASFPGCSSMVITNVGKLLDVHSGNWPIETMLQNGASGFTSNLLQLHVSQAAGTGFNFFETCAGANATTGACTTYLDTIRGDGLLTVPAVTIPGATSGAYVKADGTGYGTPSGIGSITGYSALVSGASTTQWTTPVANSQCLMSAASNFATTAPSFQNCPGGGGLSGLTTDGVLYATGATSATTNAPPTTNGAYVLTENVTANAAVAPTFALPGVRPRASTCVSNVDTILATDRVGYVSENDALACVVSLPSAASFGSNFVFDICDIGAGTTTLTPVTSVISYSTGSAYIASATSMTITTGQCARIYSDNLNYFAIRR